MVAGALPQTTLGAHDAPKPQSGFVGTQVGRAIEKVGNPWPKRSTFHKFSLIGKQQVFNYKKLL
jgi:hypothetical protein